MEDAEGKPSGTRSAFLKQHLRNGTLTTLFLFMVSSWHASYVYQLLKGKVIEDGHEKLSSDDKTSRSNYWKVSSVLKFLK